jgi:hypothetical protein
VFYDEWAVAFFGKEFRSQKRLGKHRERRPINL